MAAPAASAAHSHPLAYTTAGSRVWRCSVCRALTTGGHAFRCEACAYNECLACFREHDSRMLLPSTYMHEHALVRYAAGSMYGALGFECNVCRADFGAVPAYHCRVCDWDECSACFDGTASVCEPRASSTTAPPPALVLAPAAAAAGTTAADTAPAAHAWSPAHAHALQFVTDRPPRWFCNVCRAQPTDACSFYCHRCDWDECTACFTRSHSCAEVPTRFAHAHELTRVDGRNFFCNLCKVSRASDTSWHCTGCDWDECTSCAALTRSHKLEEGATLTVAAQRVPAREVCVLSAHGTGMPAASSTQRAVKESDAASLEAELESFGRAIVCVYAPWCEASKCLLAAIEPVSHLDSQVPWLKMNGEQCRLFCEETHVAFYPTVLLLGAPDGRTGRTPAVLWSFTGALGDA